MPPEAPGQPPIETGGRPGGVRWGVAPIRSIRSASRHRILLLDFPIAVRGSSSCRAGDTVSGNDSDRSLQIVDNPLRLRRNPPSLCSRACHLLHAYARKRRVRPDGGNVERSVSSTAPSAGVQRAPVWRALATLTDVAPIPGDEVPQASALGFASWDPPRAVDERRP
jgi:hypothetical protein